jgi:uncharacterized membrane protein YidH (DUF202 family)
LDKTSLALLVMGVVLAPLGIYLATFEDCVAYMIVLVQQICTQRGLPYQAPGYALLILGILLFVVGLILLILGRQEGRE